jgi:hypothetical protein
MSLNNNENTQFISLGFAGFNINTDDLERLKALLDEITQTDLNVKITSNLLIFRAN